MIAFREFSTKWVPSLPPREHIPHWNAKVCQIPKLNRRKWNFSRLFWYSGLWRNVLRLFGVFLTLLWSRYIHMCRRFVHLYLFRKFYSLITIYEKIVSGEDISLWSGRREAFLSHVSDNDPGRKKEHRKRLTIFGYLEWCSSGRTHKT